LVVEGYLHAAMQEVEGIEDRESWNWEEAKRFKLQRLEICAQNKPRRKQPKAESEEADS
jgi:hypothetical protein